MTIEFASYTDLLAFVAIVAVGCLLALAVWEIICWLIERWTKTGDDIDALLLTLREEP